MTGTIFNMRCMQQAVRSLCLVELLALPLTASATEYHGLVTFHGLPVPGATVTVNQGGKKYVTVTDTQGFYTFPTLADGPAKLQIQMTGFSPTEASIAIATDTAAGQFELKLLTLEAMRSELKPTASAPITVLQARVEPAKTGEAPKPKADAAATPAAPPEEAASKAADGLLINGSVNNAATSQFSLASRFGNTASGKSMYNVSLFTRIDNSALDARSYSLAGFNTPKPETDQFTGGITVGGPLKIPGLLRNGPNILFSYQRVRNSISVTTPGLVPTLAERAGILPFAIYDSANNTSYAAGSVVPITPQAQALINLYPLPNILDNSIYNYQVPLVNDTHQDFFNSNASKTIGRKNQINGTFASQSIRTSATSLLGFTDATGALGLNTNINWAHTYNARLRTNVGYTFSRQSNRTTPYWANRSNVSGVAGITGNDQDPAYWGPPTLNFSSALAPLTDANNTFLRNATNGISYVLHWNRSPHNFTVGGDFRRQQFNYLTEANPRGTFTFSSANAGGTGSDVADFLLGIPAASSIAYGNADKYLRETVYDLYGTDDWRASPQLTINAGVRWEYGSPVTELKNRLVNLDVVSDFAAVAPVLASTPKGPLTGIGYPNSLTRPDRTAVEPRIGLSWRPLPGSSLIVGAGYGVTYDTSVYQGIALNMAQQAPLSISQTVQNSATCPLSLARAFTPCGTTTAQTFGVDPNFRVGYVQTWNLKLQRDLPSSLQLVAIYLGNKGTRGAQLFLPNTAGETAPSGYEYLASYGDSTRESGQIQLRRRLKSGFTASVLYTYSKSIDDDSALGGQGAATLSTATIAQDWRHLNAERGLSTFDQRHLLNLTVQYTTGMGIGGGSLLSGWRGRLYKEWTVQTQINAGSGLPETPLVSARVISGYNSFIRPDLTGAPLYNAAGFVNPLAYTTPATLFGNARRDSITGPSEFTLNAALVRTFRLPDRLSLDLQFAANNALNHVSFASYYNDINSTQFGLPSTANAMRTLQTSLRLRY